MPTGPAEGHHRGTADPPPLSAAAEVTAYRIVVEALTNVARHSPSEAAGVTIEAPAGWLSLVVTDGCPPAAGGDDRLARAASALTSMRGTRRPGRGILQRRPHPRRRARRGSAAARVSSDRGSDA